MPVSIITPPVAQPAAAALTVNQPAATALPIPQPPPATLLVAQPLGTAPAPVPALATGAGLVMAYQQVRRPAYELWCALIVVVAISGLYVGLALPSVPKPSSVLGHCLGIAGFIMMVSTETLYSLRKRSRSFTFGRMSTWLQLHVFMGIVGPYLVLLHAGWRFHGLAGLVMLLTGLIVLSGFIGRYLYTAVPRTLDGVEMAVRDLEGQIAAADGQLQGLGMTRLGAEALAVAAEVPPAGWMSVLGRGWLRWWQRRRLRRAVQHLSAVDHALANQLSRLLAERYRLLMQVRSLAAARRLLALWHVVHIPLGVVLFTLAFIHVGGALYYATFLK